MAQAAKKAAPKRTSGSNTKFTAEERAAMKERAAEMKKAQGKADGEADLLAKVKEMPKEDRDKAERLHKVITEAAPELECRTWYGMPAYSLDGDVLCFYQSAAKFKSRYPMLGFSDKAKLDKGAMWPVYFAIDELTATAEKDIAAMIRRAVKQ